MNDTSSAASSAARLQLHIAEYNALTTRCTYWLTMLNATWPLLVFVLALAAQLEKIVARPWLLWFASLSIQFIVYGYFHIIGENHTAVYYMEHVLRPLILSESVGDDFWQYESFVKGHRPTPPGIWEYGPLFFSLGSHSLATWFSAPFPITQYIAPWLAGVLFVSITVKAAFHGTRLRYSFHDREEPVVTTQGIGLWAGLRRRKD
jgi:hypothetical protein